MAQLEALRAAFGFSTDTQEYFGRLLHPEHPMLDFLNVRAVVSNTYLPTLPGMPRIDHGEADPWPAQIYLNGDALPRWFVPTAVDRIDRRQLPGWIAGLQDARRVAVFADATHESLSTVRSWDPQAVTVRHAEPGDVTLDVACSGECLLASSLAGVAGWQARGGGRALEVLAVNGAFLGVVIPADVRTVELRFVPPGLASGIALATSGLLVLGVLAWRGSSLRFRRQPAA